MVRPPCLAFAKSTSVAEVKAAAEVEIGAEAARTGAEVATPAGFGLGRFRMGRSAGGLGRSFAGLSGAP